MTFPNFNERWRRDNALLAAIHRALALPIWAIVRLFFEQCENPDAVYQVTARLKKAGMISKHSLWGKTSYYRMGPAAVAKYPWLKITDCEPLDYRRLIDTYACVAYCCGDEEIRKRALPSEVEAAFSVPRDHLHARPFVIRSYADRAPELLQIRVAMSGDATSVVAALQESIREYQKHPALRELITHDRFHFVVFFPTEQAWKPAHALMAHERSRNNFVPFETLVLPDLLKIAPPSKPKASIQ